MARFRQRRTSVEVVLPDSILKDLSTDPEIRSKVVTEALRALVSSSGSSKDAFTVDSRLHRRTVALELPADLLHETESMLSRGAWRPLAHVVEEALVAYLKDRDSGT